MKARKRPYVKLLNQPVGIGIDRDAAVCFRAMTLEQELPYQQPINL
jgi:hypothetical protein